MLVAYRGYSTFKTRTALGSYCRASPMSIQPAVWILGLGFGVWGLGIGA